jgi:hypothetical protein
MGFFNPNKPKKDSPYWRLELKKEELFTRYLFKIIEKKLNQTFEIERVYAVNQCYEQNSNFHIDNEHDNRVTFCYYINVNITESGYFYLKIPKQKYIMCIESIHNRGVVFPSNYLHKGSGFNDDNSRICIAWKLKII